MHVHIKSFLQRKCMPVLHILPVAELYITESQQILFACTSDENKKGRDRGGEEGACTRHSIYNDKATQILQRLVIFTTTTASAFGQKQNLSQGTWGAIVDDVIVMIVHQYSQGLPNHE